MQRPTPIIQVPVPAPTPGRLPQLTVRAPAPTPVVAPVVAPTPAVPKVTLPRAPSPPRVPTVVPSPGIPRITLPQIKPIPPRTLVSPRVPVVPVVTTPVKPPPPKIVPKYPYTQEQIAQCSLDEEGNIIDPITQEPILPDRIISVKEGNTYYCFDIATLYKEVREGRTDNPFTRKPLPNDVIRRVQEYKKELEVKVLPMMQYNAFTIDRDRPLGELVLDVLRAMSVDLSAITKYNIFVGDDSVYDLDLNKTLEEQKLFTEETPGGIQRVLIIPERDRTDRRIRAMYQYLKTYGPTGTLSTFLQAYPQVEPPEDRRVRLEAEAGAAREAELAARTPPRQRAVSPPRVVPARAPAPQRAVSPPRPQVPRQPMDRDTAMGIVAVLNEDYTEEGAPPQEILQTAYDALRNYTVTAEIAHAMDEALNPNLRRNLYQVLHIIYAAVSDKNNLREGYGVEGYYAGRPQGPNYYNTALGPVDLGNINLY